MALPYRLAHAVFGEYLQLYKLGLVGSSSRFYSTAVDSYGQKKGDWLDNWGKFIVPKRQLPPWPEDFKEHPERDLVNFPHPVTKLYESKIRLGFIPDSWFQFFYKKTGVTGPYLFGWGLIAFLLQKEIWVMEHEFKHLPPIVVLAFLGYKLYGSKIGAWAEKLHLQDEDEDNAMLDSLKKVHKDAVQTENTYQDCYPAMVKYIAESKRENVGLQLEISYRNRIQKAFAEVKRRADYLAESEETKRRFEQTHMVNWIVDQVRKSITPQQEQTALKQCISDLKNLAPA